MNNGIVNEKIKCCKCGGYARWYYMPGSNDSTDGKEDYYCDKHVSRGCTCNWRNVQQEPPPTDNNDWKWITAYDGKPLPAETYWVRLDEQGREYPCCEYDYEKDGFLVNEK